MSGVGCVGTQLELVGTAMDVRRCMAAWRQAKCEQCILQGRRTATCERWMQVTMTGVKPASALGPSRRRWPTATAPATTVPDTTDPTPRTSNVWSTCDQANQNGHAGPRVQGFALMACCQS